MPDLEQTIPGTTDLRSFTHILDFVADREKYSKRIKHLEQKTQECNEAVKRVVALNALGALQNQVRRAQEAADTALRVAQEKAEEIREKADKVVEARYAEITVVKNELATRVCEEDERLRNWEAELKSREETTNVKKEASLAELARAETLHRTGVELKDRYGNALAALTKITNEV